MISETGPGPFWKYIYKYDKNGNKIYRRNVGRLGTGTGYEYDSQGRVIREYSELRDENGERQSERWYEYDEMGNLIHDITLNLGIKREYWISYNNNNKISEKYVSTCDQDTYVRNTIYEYDENGNCIYELCTCNEYEKSRLVDSWEEETFYEYIKDDDIDMKYTYMTEKKQNLF